MPTSAIGEIAREGQMLVLMNRREISARRGLIVSGDADHRQDHRPQAARPPPRAAGPRAVPGRAATGSRSSTSPARPRARPRKLAMEFARFLGLPLRTRANVTDIADAVCQVLIDARTDLVLVDEIHNLNHGTPAGEDLSDHLKYFTEHLPATFIYAGIDVERCGCSPAPAAASSPAAAC